ncbi:MAG: Glu-tRNA(Gln) amidotransferase subunit GatD [Candidatus Eisenbacteria bacterium]|nr:Glu-tRNA(Gln) amidotransferase subunit GatD [Candidatus Eisenbacteria bacterium]
MSQAPVTTDGDRYKGYRPPALDVLREHKVQVWSDVEITSSRGAFRGLILPRSETADPLHIVLKLNNGYNIGLRADTIRTIREVGTREARYRIPEKAFPVDPAKPDVTLLGTGGTIASRLDYRTGAVVPAFSPGELYGAVPELADYCNLTTRKLYGEFSENIGPKHWIGAARAVGEAIEAGAHGILIGHGTDTMHYTAAALTFMVQDPPVPIIMVGSQRSSDRPSSDAALNLINSTHAAARADIAEVMVCMFGPTSDQYGLLHPGTRVRKMHSSYRSTFRTIGDIPLATVSAKEIKPLRRDYRPRRSDRQANLHAVFEERVSLVYYYPNMQPDIIDALVDNGYKGLVIAGTGLGHVNKPIYGALERALQQGVQVFMTVQTLWGYAQMYVYDTGRDLMKMGIFPLANMLPETAYVKLGWVLGQTQEREEVRRLMLRPVCREITEREPHDGYLVFQGGIPEVDAMMKRLWK